MNITLSKNIYPRIAVLKAAFSYTETAYVHIDADENYYIVSIEEKEPGTVDEKEFMNEVLNQSLRSLILEKTKNLRESIAMRSMASSLINLSDDKNPEVSSVPDETDFNEEEILKEWFSKNEYNEI